MIAFRADHVGSLLRPKKLREAFRAHSEKKIDDQALHAAVSELAASGGAHVELVSDGRERTLSAFGRG